MENVEFIMDNMFKGHLNFYPSRMALIVDLKVKIVYYYICRIMDNYPIL